MEENQGLHLRPNDRLLLCSDGLTDLVEDHEIQQLIQEMEQEQAVEKLIDLANQRGGHDNITIVILRVPETLPDATQPVSLSQAPAKKKRSAWILPIVGIMALILFLVVAGGIFFFFQRSNEVVISPTRATQDTSVTQPIVLPTASLMTGEATNESSTSIVPIQTEIETVQPALVTPLITLTPWPTNTLAP
jgi:hypothetical protein